MAIALFRALLLYFGTNAKASIFTRSLIPSVSHVPSCVEKSSKISYKGSILILIISPLGIKFFKTQRAGECVKEELDLFTLLVSVRVPLKCWRQRTKKNPCFRREIIIAKGGV